MVLSTKRTLDIFLLHSALDSTGNVCVSLLHVRVRVTRRSLLSTPKSGGDVQYVHQSKYSLLIDIRKIVFMVIFST